MRTIQLDLPESESPGGIVSLIERAVAAGGLKVVLKASLARFPGCTHWHVNRGRERGTMEITYVPSTRQAWIECRQGRDAEWVKPASRQLAQYVKAAHASLRRSNQSFPTSRKHPGTRH